MNLKLVTWECDNTQFLVQATNDAEAIEKAYDANCAYMPYDEEIIDDIEDKSTYLVEDVDFEMLAGLVARDDLLIAYDDAIVFNG